MLIDWVPRANVCMKIHPAILGDRTSSFSQVRYLDMHPKAGGKLECRVLCEPPGRRL